MTALASPAAHTADRGLQPLPVALLLLFAIILPIPVGYVGGGGDDWFYVEAARCVAAHGWCVPETHWAARWPLVAPMGGVFALFGDSWLASTIVPLAYTVIALAAFVKLLELTSGRTAALVGGIAFVGTASIAKGLLQPNIETVELAWLLVAALAAQRALARDQGMAAFAAGTAFGLAIASRMTSLAWLPLLTAAWWLLPPDRRRHVGLFLLGLLFIAVGDMLINLAVAGDALLGPHLSAAHTRIASSELPAHVDRSRSPLFNPQFIGGWAPTMGLHAPWWIQGALNLFANPQIAPTLFAALALLFLRRRELGWRNADLLLVLAGACYAGALIYALAIDPKARMFLPVAAIAAAIIGRLGVRAWAEGERPIVAGLLAVIIVIGIGASKDRYDMGRAGPLAAAWAAEYPGDVMVEDATRRFLTFTPAVRLLPVAPADRGHVIVLQAGACREAHRTIGPDWLPVQSRGFGLPGDPLNLCLFRRSQ